jgi:CheY-like chemotaxis protein
MSEQQQALVIEDDFDAAVIFSQALVMNGFQTEIIRSGDKALERLKDFRPALVLLDLHLPQVAGTDILAYIRSQERLRRMRVIVVTADPRMAELCQAEADLVLLKPVSFTQVRELVSRFRPAQQA